MPDKYQNQTSGNSVERSIGRLEGKIDLVIQEVSGLKVSFNTLEEGRVSTLERNFANLTGKLSMIAAGVSVAISVLFIFLQNMIK